MTVTYNRPNGCVKPLELPRSANTIWPAHWIKHGIPANALDPLCVVQNDTSLRLHWSAANGDVVLLRQLLPDGHDPESWNSQQWMPIHGAVAAGHLKCVQVLLEHGCLADTTFPNKATLLMAAIQRQHFNVAELLLHWGADMNTYWLQAWSPTAFAIEAGMDGLIEQMAFGIRVRDACSPGRWDSVSMAAAYGRLACVKHLFRHTGFVSEFRENRLATKAAAQFGHVSVLKYFKSLGSKCHTDHPNAGDRFRSYGQEDLATPLMHAAMGGQKEVVRWLLDEGARPWDKSYRGNTAFSLAAECGHFHVCEELLQPSEEHSNLMTHEFDAIQAIEDVEYVMDRAIRRRNLAVLESLFSGGYVAWNKYQTMQCSIADCIRSGSVHFLRYFVSCFCGHYFEEVPRTDEKALSGMIYALLEEDVDLSHVLVAIEGAIRGNDHRMLAYLMAVDLFSDFLRHAEMSWPQIAAGSGSMRVLALFNELGFDDSTATGDVPTTLMCSAIYGQRDVFDWLIANEKFSRTQLDDGSDLLMMAAYGGSLPIVEKLIQMGLDVNATNAHGWTPLMFAGAGDHVPVAKLLLDKGADVSQVSVDGFDAAMAASWFDAEAFVRFWLEAGHPLDGRSIQGDTVVTLSYEPTWTDTVVSGMGGRSVWLTPGCFECCQKEVCFLFARSAHDHGVPEAPVFQPGVDIQSPRPLPLLILLSERMAHAVGRTCKIKNEDYSRADHDDLKRKKWRDRLKSQLASISS